jgi:hypothetical protein
VLDAGQDWAGGQMNAMPLGSVAYGPEPNAKAERLIGMVGVGPGYIVTDTM